MFSTAQLTGPQDIRVKFKISVFHSFYWFIPEVSLTKLLPGHWIYDPTLWSNELWSNIVSVDDLHGNYNVANHHQNQYWLISLTNCHSFYLKEQLTMTKYDFGMFYDSLLFQWQIIWSYTHSNICVGGTCYTQWHSRMLISFEIYWQRTVLRQVGFTEIVTGMYLCKQIPINDFDTFFSIIMTLGSRVYFVFSKFRGSLKK